MFSCDPSLNIFYPYLCEPNFFTSIVSYIPPDVVVNNSSGGIVLFTTLIGAFAGAAIAFYLQNLREKRQEKIKSIGAINRALFTLYKYWQTQSHYCAKYITHMRTYRPEEYWFRLPVFCIDQYDPIPLATDDLTFILNKNEYNVFRHLFLEEDRYNSFLLLMREHLENYNTYISPMYSQIDFEDTSIPFARQAISIVGITNCSDIAQIVDNIVVKVGQNIELLPEVNAKLRKYASSLYPKTKFIETDVPIVENIVHLDTLVVHN